MNFWMCVSVFEKLCAENEFDMKKCDRKNGFLVGKKFQSTVVFSLEESLTYPEKRYDMLIDDLQSVLN